MLSSALLFADRGRDQAALGAAVRASSLRKIRPTGIGKSILANSSRKTSMKPPTIDVPPAQAMSIGSLKLGMFWPDSKRDLMFSST